MVSAVIFRAVGAGSIILAAGAVNGPFYKKPRNLWFSCRKV